MKRSYIFMLSIAMTMMTVACSKNESNAPEVSKDSTATPASSEPATPIGVQEIKKLTADQVGVKLTLESQPKVDTASGSVSFVVKVENHGVAALSGASNPPVNLGVQILGPDGSAEGMVRDFSRTPLPDIAPGNAASVTVQFPLESRLDGRKLKVDVVQEGVSWFSDFGQPTLELDPVK
ncbi:hypothetical protein FHY13_001958 [Xanthomonas arboricola]|uniref:hypothetical protein n=1 Tax=Xanthomonas TaxID=338 RepID=UPI000F8E8065|nr:MULTISPECIES: hypothetical protein [Xanthomonas]MBB3813611.1 hypothetical protein [Xanthomonas euroxanthea]